MPAQLSGGNVAEMQNFADILIRLRVKLRRTRILGLIPRCLHRSLSPELALGFIPFDLNLTDINMRITNTILTMFADKT
jgi:hypothetical protein